MTVFKDFAGSVSRETCGALERYVELLVGESKVQNLISPTSINELWTRHIADSAQLLNLVPRGSWIDIGSGAGLPGVVLSIFGIAPMTLVEPRKLRAEFLRRCVSELALDAEVVQAKVEQITGKFDIITARAVAPLDKLLGISVHLAHSGTQWVLPKGRNADSELVEAQRSWHYDVRAEPSCTDPKAKILLLSNVRARRKP